MKDKTVLTQVLHAPRYQKKLLLKGWLSSQQQQQPDRFSQFTFAQPSENETDQSPMQAAPSTASSLSLDVPVNPIEEPLQLMKTVAQIQQVYRRHAREEEAESTRKALNDVTLRPMADILRHSLQKHSKQPIRSHENNDSASGEPVVRFLEENEEEEMEQETQDEQKPESGWDLKRLDVSRVLLDRCFRERVLVEIHNRLSQGTDVVLANDLLAPNATLKDSKLVLQQLCQQSLMYCKLDQELIPQVVNPSQVRLVLKSKVTHHSQ